MLNILKLKIRAILVPSASLFAIFLSFNFAPAVSSQPSPETTTAEAPPDIDPEILKEALKDAYRENIKKKLKAELVHKAKAQFATPHNILGLNTQRKIDLSSMGLGELDVVLNEKEQAEILRKEFNKNSIYQIFFDYLNELQELLEKLDKAEVEIAEKTGKPTPASKKFINVSSFDPNDPKSVSKFWTKLKNKVASMGREKFLEAEVIEQFPTKTLLELHDLIQYLQGEEFKHAEDILRILAEIDPTLELKRYMEKEGFNPNDPKEVSRFWAKLHRQVTNDGRISITRNKFEKGYPAELLLLFYDKILENEALVNQAKKAPYRFFESLFEKAIAAIKKAKIDEKSNTYKMYRKNKTLIRAKNGLVYLAKDMAMFYTAIAVLQYAKCLYAGDPAGCISNFQSLKDWKSHAAFASFVATSRYTSWAMLSALENNHLRKLKARGMPIGERHQTAKQRRQKLAGWIGYVGMAAGSTMDHLVSDLLHNGYHLKNFFVNYFKSFKDDNVKWKEDLVQYGENATVHKNFVARTTNLLGSAAVSGAISNLVLKPIEHKISSKLLSNALAQRMSAKLPAWLVISGKKVVGVTLHIRGTVIFLATVEVMPKVLPLERWSTEKTLKNKLAKSEVALREYFENIEENISKEGIETFKDHFEKYMKKLFEMKVHYYGEVEGKRMQYQHLTHDFALGMHKISTYYQWILTSGVDLNHNLWKENNGGWRCGVKGCLDGNILGLVPDELKKELEATGDLQKLMDSSDDLQIDTEVAQEKEIETMLRNMFCGVDYKDSIKDMIASKRGLVYPWYRNKPKIKAWRIETLPNDEKHCGKTKAHHKRRLRKIRSIRSNPEEYVALDTQYMKQDDDVYIRGQVIIERLYGLALKGIRKEIIHAYKGKHFEITEHSNGAMSVEEDSKWLYNPVLRSNQTYVNENDERVVIEYKQGLENVFEYHNNFVMELSNEVSTHFNENVGNEALMESMAKALESMEANSVPAGTEVDNDEIACAVDLLTPTPAAESISRQLETDEDSATFVDERSSNTRSVEFEDPEIIDPEIDEGTDVFVEELEIESEGSSTSDFEVVESEDVYTNDAPAVVEGPVNGSNTVVELAIPKTDRTNHVAVVEVPKVERSNSVVAVEIPNADGTNELVAVDDPNNTNATENVKGEAQPPVDEEILRQMEKAKATLEIMQTFQAYVGTQRKLSEDFAKQYEYVLLPDNLIDKLGPEFEKYVFDLGFYGFQQENIQKLNRRPKRKSIGSTQ